MATKTIKSIKITKEFILDNAEPEIEYIKNNEGDEQSSVAI